MANQTGFISSAWADDWLAILLKNDTSKLLDEVFVGLSHELPSDTEGTGLMPPDDPDYARVSIPLDSASWASMGVGSRLMATNIDVLFDAASVDWVNLQCYTLHDALTGGRFLGYGFITPYTILVGGKAQFLAGTIVFGIPGTQAA